MSDTKQPEDVFVPDKNPDVAPAAKPGIQSMGEKMRQVMAGAPIPPQKPPEPPADGFTPVSDDKIIEARKEATPPPPPPPKPPAEPAKPAEPVTSEATRENFKKLEKKASEYERKAADLEAKLAAAQEGTAKYDQLQKDLESRQAQIAELEIYRKRYELESSPEFTEHFDRRINSAIQDAKDAVPIDSQSRIEGVMKQPPGQWRDKALREIVAEVEDDFGKQMLVTAYRQLRDTQRERDEELSKARLDSNFDRLKEMKAKEHTDRQRAAEAARDAFWRNLEGDLDKELDASGDVELPKRAKDRLKRLIEGTLDAEGYTEVLKTAATGYRASRTEAAKDARIAELTAQLEQLQSATPSMGGGTRQPAAPNKSMTDKFYEHLGRTPGR